MTEPDHIKKLRRRQEQLESWGNYNEAATVSRKITLELEKLAAPPISEERKERHFPEPEMHQRPVPPFIAARIANF